MDMTSVIQPKSDQINADDLIGGPMTVTVDSVSIQNTTEQPISIKLTGMQKVFRPCKSMARVMVQAWGSDASKYYGRSMTLYRDPKVKWAGMEVGGIRISHMSHIDAPMSMMLTTTRSQRTPFKVIPMQDTTKPPSAPSDAAELAREAANGGTDKFTAWWNSDTGKLCRAAVTPIMDELKRAASDADAARTPTTTDDDEAPL